MGKDKRRLDDWLSTFLEYTEPSESPTSFFAWTAVGLLASALERRVWLPWSLEGKLYPNNYILMIGDSALSRKSDPVRFGRDIGAAAGIYMLAEQNTRESVWRELGEEDCDARREYRVGKTLYTQTAVLAIAEEFASFTGRENIEFLADMTAWYDCPQHTWVRRTKHQGVDEIIGVCLNIIASMAPTWIPYIFSREAISGGFTSRVIIVTELRKRKTVLNPWAQTYNKKMKKDLVNDLKHIREMKGVFKWDKRGEAFYTDWYREHDIQMMAGNPPLIDERFSGYCGRRQTHLIKTAMACSISRGDTLTIKRQDIERALTLILDTESKMQNAFRSVGRSRFADFQPMVLSLIRREKACTTAHILQFFHLDLDHYSLEAIIKNLSVMKEVQVIKKKGTTTVKYIGNNVVPLHPTDGDER